MADLMLLINTQMQPNASGRIHDRLSSRFDTIKKSCGARLWLACRREIQIVVAAWLRQALPDPASKMP
jgi:hypothetical protein